MGGQAGGQARGTHRRMWPNSRVVMTRSQSYVPVWLRNSARSVSCFLAVHGMTPTCRRRGWPGAVRDRAAGLTGMLARGWH